MAMNPNPSGSLEDQVGELRSRLLRLERALQARGIVVEPAAPASVEALISTSAPAATSPAAPSVGVPQPPQAWPAQPPVTPPAFGTFDKAAREDTRSLESRIGSQWFNRVGILAMLIGVAWFLKLAFDNHWIGPLGRVFHRISRRCGAHRLVRAFRKARIYSLCLFPQSRRKRHALPLVVGSLFGLLSDAGRRRFRCDDLGHRV